MGSLVRSLPVLACVGLMAACSSPASPGEGTGTDDAGIDAGTGPTDSGPPPDAGPDCNPNNLPDGGLHGHQSYVGTPPPTSPARLIVIGDSISYGYGATDASTGAYYSLLDTNDNTQWPSEMAVSLAAKYGTTLPVVNVSYPGATTTSMVSGGGGQPNQIMSLTSKLPLAGRSIVVITIGGNDLLALVENALLGQGVTAAEIQTTVNTAIMNITTMINFLQSPTNFPDGTDIYLANVYDPTDNTGVLPPACVSMISGGALNMQITEPTLATAPGAISGNYIALAQSMHFSIVDALGHFYGHGVNATDANSGTSHLNYDVCDPVNWFYTDCIHPNDIGHNELRNIFFEAITGDSASAYLAPDP